MKILINAGFFSIVPCADNNIEVELAKQFIKKGHECEIIGMTYDVEEPIVYVDGIKVIKIPFYKQIFMDARFASKKALGTDGSTPISSKDKIKFLLTHPIYAILMQMNKYKSFREKLLSDYLVEAKKVIKKGSYDVLIGVVYSFDQTEKLFLCDDIKMKKIYYQLDPHGMNRMFSHIKEECINKEIKVMEKSDWIITTHELVKQYKECDKYSHLLSKMTALDFPTYNTDLNKAAGESLINFDSSKINILFSGTVDDIHRNPNKCLEIMNKVLVKRQDINLYFLGYFYSESGKQYIEENNIDVKILPPVSYNDAVLAMQNCDILLNIGNEVVNMVPSKLFTYFSLCKPIINVEKIPNSPAQRYMKKYPMQITINEFENIDYTEQLEKFIDNSKQYQYSCDDINLIYESATPSFVANEMLSIISSLK